MLSMTVLLSQKTRKAIRKFTENAPVVLREKEDGTPYQYVVLPLEAVNEPEFLDGVVDGILSVTDVSKANKIVTMEAKGIPIATALSLRTGIPFVIARKRKYGLPGEVKVEQTKAYKGRAQLFINWIKKGDRVLVVDDIVSSGGTMAAIIEGLRKTGAEISDFVVVWDRGEGVRFVQEKTGVRIKSLARLELSNNKPTVRFHGQ